MLESQSILRRITLCIRHTTRNGFQIRCDKVHKLISLLRKCLRCDSHKSRIGMRVGKSTRTCHESTLRDGLAETRVTLSETTSFRVHTSRSENFCQNLKRHGIYTTRSGKRYGDFHTLTTRTNACL